MMMVYWMVSHTGYSGAQREDNHPGSIRRDFFPAVFNG
jgi:hypothetical protein